MVIQGISYPSDFEAKKQMIELGRRMDEKSHVIAGEGSLSVRVGPNAVWITAEGAEKGTLKQESFIRVDMNGKQSPGSRQTRLPEDLAVHLGVYAQNPALRGVIHGYPAGAVAYAALGREVEAADYTPSVRALGRISLVSRQNAEGQAKAAALVCRSDKGILAAGDGCFMWGESLMEAFHSLETLEYYVKIKRMLCAGRSGAGGCGETRASSAPVFSPEQREAQEAPFLAAAPAAAVTAPLEMEGLTPLIRPGDAAGFHLPVQTVKPAAAGAQAETAKSAVAGAQAETAKSAVVAAQIRTAKLTAAGAQAQTAKSAVAAAQIQTAKLSVAGAQAQTAKPAAAAVQAQTVSRAEMMAEVIRRSLSSIQ